MLRACRPVVVVMGVVVGCPLRRSCKLITACVGDVLHVDGLPELLHPLNEALKRLMKPSAGWSDALNVVYLEARLAVRAAVKDVMSRRLPLQLQDEVRKARGIRELVPVYDMNFDPDKAESEKQKVGSSCLVVPAWLPLQRVCVVVACADPPLAAPREARDQGRSTRNPSRCGLPCTGARLWVWLVCAAGRAVTVAQDFLGRGVFPLTTHSHAVACR